MRTIAHLSNLRIGRRSQEMLNQIESWMERLQPSLLVVSGNVTHSGSHWQFQAAQAFLGRLPSPRIVVPGDTDTPYWDPIARIVSPWENFETYFGKSRTPYFADNELILAGLRTAVAWPYQTPALARDEWLFLQELMASAEPGMIKAVVAHHPLFFPDKFEPSEEDQRVFRSQVDLFITGNLRTGSGHQGQRESDTAVFLGVPKHDPFSFQLLRLERATISCENYLWESQSRDFKLDNSQQRRLLVLNVRSA
jgi:hypothetical protein